MAKALGRDDAEGELEVLELVLELVLLLVGDGQDGELDLGPPVLPPLELGEERPELVLLVDGELVELGVEELGRADEPVGSVRMDVAEERCGRFGALSCDEGGSLGYGQAPSETCKDSGGVVSSDELLEEFGRGGVSEGFSLGDF